MPVYEVQGPDGKTYEFDAPNPAHNHTMSEPKLFTPMTVGEMTLQHRVVMAPLTRVRATSQHVPTEIMVEYYAQRASVPGTLIISEATFIAPQAGGFPNVPGIWSEEQIQQWKKVRVTCAGAHT